MLSHPCCLHLHPEESRELLISMNNPRLWSLSSSAALSTCQQPLKVSGSSKGQDTDGFFLSMSQPNALYLGCVLGGWERGVWVGGTDSDPLRNNKPNPTWMKKGCRTTGGDLVSEKLKARFASVKLWVMVLQGGPHPLALVALPRLQTISPVGWGSAPCPSYPDFLFRDRSLL